MARRQRTAVRQETIVEELRRQIVSGRLRPGERLPTHLDLQEAFATTQVTIQRALSRLADEGFVVSEPKIGRFVTPYPPHRWMIGIVIPTDEPNLPPARRSRYWLAVEMAARFISRLTPYRFRFYYGIDRRSDSDSYRRLRQDALGHRLAGVIFTVASSRPEGLLVEQQEVPQVSWGRSDDPRVPGLIPDEPARLHMVLDWIRDQGRSRVALIARPTEPPDLLSRAEVRLAERNLTTRPFWTQAVDPFRPQWVRHALHAVLSSEGRVVPDALIVTDDHLVEATGQAISDLGVNVPRDLVVVGHWNFPLSFSGPAGVKLIGFDARWRLVQSIQILTRMYEAPHRRYRSSFTPRADDDLDEEGLRKWAKDVVRRAASCRERSAV